MTRARRFQSAEPMQSHDDACLACQCVRDRTLGVKLLGRLGLDPIVR